MSRSARPSAAAARPTRAALAALVAVAAGALAAPSAVTAQPSRFTVRAIPTLGGASSFARDISSNGLVTGNAQLPVGAAPPRLNAYLWDGSTLTNLGTVPGSNNFSRGYGVNAAGVVVGESDNDRPRAFRWAGGTMTPLPTLGGASAVAHGINDAGQIVGIASTGTVSRPVIWEDDGATVRDLGAADGSTDSFGRAWGIGAGGDVVGFSRSAAGVSQATLWADGGAAVSLGSLGDGARFSEAYAVNGRGQVVGRSFTGALTPGGTSIFEAFLWEEGAMTGLGSLGFTFSQANDVNGAGWIVGSATNVSGLPAAAVLWEGGVGVDLNTRLVRGARWTLRSAEGINGRGQIVGYGTLDGQTRGFVLTPVPEPGTVALLGGGLVALAVGGLRRRGREDAAGTRG